MNIEKIQRGLKENGIEGWLMYDFQGRNDIAINMLGIDAFLSRKFVYLIPAEGEPVGIFHNIEKDKFAHLPGEKILFSGYLELEENLKKILTGYKKIAMEYFSDGRLPYIGLIDAGTIEFIRRTGVEIVSSADLVASFLACLTEKQVKSHKFAANLVVETRRQAWNYISDSLKNGKTITEFDVVQFIHNKYAEHDMVFDHPVNCSVNANAGNPHYEPTAESAAPIKKGDLILIDMWARENHANGVFADITGMAFAGSKDEIPEKYIEIFAVISAARDRAVEFLAENKGKTTHGCDVDDACREVITKAGYGQYFTHRTGHSIAYKVHGPGPNIDNLETEDRRLLQPGHLFSIEPGIYTAEFGMRTEINVLMTENGPEITTPPCQMEIEALL